MRFFEGIRPEVYIHGVKLRRDKKTGKRLWALTCIVTLTPELVLTCDETVNAAYIYLLTLDNLAAEVLLDSQSMGAIVDFFAKLEDKKPAVHLEGFDIGGLRLTRSAEVAELWFQFEIENNAGLHAFIKEYAYTRVYAKFAANQGELGFRPMDGGPVETAAQSLIESCERNDVTMTISTPGTEAVVVNGGKRKRKPKDPG